MVNTTPGSLTTTSLPPSADSAPPATPTSPVCRLPATPRSRKYERGHKCGDPFRTLDDLCLHSILTCLSLRDLASCSDVSRLWRSRLEYLITPSLIRSHLPFYSASFPTASERFLEFRRLAYREGSLSRASATWHLQFPNASQYSAAGNFVVWHRARSNVVNWHILPRQGEGKLELPVMELLRRYEVETVLVNSEGVLFIRGSFEGGTDRKGGLKLWRDQTYLLPQKTLIWRKDSLQSNTTKPLFLGSTRAYLLSLLKTAEPRVLETAIHAVSLEDGQILYERKIPDSLFRPNDDACSSVTKLFKLLSLHGRDFIVDLRGSLNFSIIDGDTGNVLQTIAHNGLGGCNVIPVPSATVREFILWSNPSLVEEYSKSGNCAFARRTTQQTLTQQPDGTFVRTDVRTVSYRHGAIFTVHPFGDYGFCLGIRGLSVLKVVPDDKARRQQPPNEPHMGRQFRVSEAKLVLAPQRGGKMGKCEVDVRWLQENRPVGLLDQGRIMFDDTTANDRTLHIVEFGPGW